MRHWQSGTMIRRFCTDAGWTTTGTPGRKVACVSEKFVEQAIGGSAQDAIGKAVTLAINQDLYTFYIQGVYKYTEDSYSSMFGGSDDDSIQTDFYIPLDVAKAIAGAGGRVPEHHRCGQRAARS